jgi:hypothetical protein
MNWKNGKPNARYWTLKLLKENFGPGDKLVYTTVNNADVISQAFITRSGKKILLINPRNKEAKINLPSEADVETIYLVDDVNEENGIVQIKPAGNSITLKPFAVTVVQVNK